MTPEISSLVQACEWFPSQFLIFSNNVYAPLIYYSHLGVLIPTLLIGLFIFVNSRKNLSSTLLLLTVLSFSAWIYSDLVLWATESPKYVMFFWALEVLIEPFVYFFAFYFFYAFVFKKDFSSWQKVLFLLPVLPTIALAWSHLALIGYDISNCDRAAVEGILGTYGYAIELLYALLIIGFGIYAVFARHLSGQRVQNILLTIGVTAFLLSFSLGNIVEVFTEEWSIGQYGLFGAPIFIAFLAYLIIRFKAFNVKLIGAQALVAALWLLTLALLFVRTIENVRIIVSITLVFVLILGVLLVRGVYREIDQRERIEKLAKNLETANKQQIILIHFITHQIKGFVTKSRNIFSLMKEGDLGPVPEAMQSMVEEGFRSDTKGVNTIQEILNAANIKSGKVTYSKEPFDLKGLIDEILRDLKAGADAKGLELKTDTGSAPLMYPGDEVQLTNALKNLIDNSIKYTMKGEVRVSLKQEDTKVRFSVEDTGVGITPEDMAHLFTEGGHGANSAKVNVESTGFGLYIVKNIIEAHGGKVWAESDGEGKGSRFIAELPA